VVQSGDGAVLELDSLELLFVHGGAPGRRLRVGGSVANTGVAINDATNQQAENAFNEGADQKFGSSLVVADVRRLRAGVACGALTWLQPDRFP
jgi:hypothetical protein